MKHEEYKEQFHAWTQLTEQRLTELCDTYPVSYTHLTLPTKRIV